jgi:hypothetical protein
MVPGTTVSHPDGQRYVVEARPRTVWTGEYDLVGLALDVALDRVSNRRGTAWIVEVRRYPRGRAVLTERATDDQEAQCRAQALLAEIASGERSF